MTTVLQLYARAAAMFAAALAFLFLFGGVVAFAQDIPVVTAEPLPGPDDSWASFVVMIRDGFIATVLAMLSGLFAWLAPKLPAWVRAVIDSFESRDSKDWEGYVRNLAETAFASVGGAAANKLDTLEGKAGALGGMLAFVRRYGDDLYRYMDKDDNKVLDVLEAHLRRIEPKTAVTPNDEPPMQQMGFVAQPAPKARPRHIPVPPPPPIPTRRRPEARPMQ